MSTVHVVLARSTARDGNGDGLPIMDASDRGAAQMQSVTLTGTQTTAFSVPDDAGDDFIWDLTAGSADKYVAFGVNPDPTQNPRWRLNAGAQRNWAAIPGTKCAVINA